jgi:hypothetical protein
MLQWRMPPRTRQDLGSPGVESKGHGRQHKDLQDSVHTQIRQDFVPIFSSLVFTTSDVLTRIVAIRGCYRLTRRIEFLEGYYHHDEADELDQ